MRENLKPGDEQDEMEYIITDSAFEEELINGRMGKNMQFSTCFTFSMHVKQELLGQMALIK